MNDARLPPLRPEYEPTRATLHAYAHAVGSIPRAHGIAHPRWWHISLKVRPEGLVTDPIPLPHGGALALTMDLRRHEIALRTSTGRDRSFDMTSGMTGSELGHALTTEAAGFGLDGPFDHTRFQNDEPRAYDPVAAAGYFGAFTIVATAFEHHRVALGHRVGPIQVWPHGFDLAFEWFGNGTKRNGEDGPEAQLNLGFYPGGVPYFYSNPWPFDESLLEAVLPHGAAWHTEGWYGAVLPYSVVAGDPDGRSRLLDFARAVFDLAAPTLEGR